MPSSYNKPHQTYEQQLDLLIKRGLAVTDKALAADYLARIGYYRLSAYWYSLRKLRLTKDEATGQFKAEREDDFVPGATFQQVLDLYVFDKKLRLLLLDAIERVEVSVRVDIAYVLSAKDIFAQERPDLLHPNFTAKPQADKPSEYEKWLVKHGDLADKSRETFVKHFKEKYGLPLPIWVSIELWDFGMLSRFYEGMQIWDKRKIAQTYSIPDKHGKWEAWQVLQSWLRTINFVRNVVAHHSRLWNKNLVDQPRLPGKGTEFESLVGNNEALARPYIVLCILSYLLKKICPNSSWQKRVIALVKEFPEMPGHSISDMGFPEGWDKQAFWV